MKWCCFVFVANFSLDYNSRKSLTRDSAGFEPLEGYFDQKWDEEVTRESDSDGKSCAAIALG